MQYVRAKICYIVLFHPFLNMIAEMHPDTPVLAMSYWPTTDSLTFCSAIKVNMLIFMHF